jgi:hypothetical protein
MNCGRQLLEIGSVGKRVCKKYKLSAAALLKGMWERQQHLDECRVQPHYSDRFGCVSTLRATQYVYLFHAIQPTYALMLIYFYTEF